MKTMLRLLLIAFLPVSMAVAAVTAEVTGSGLFGYRGSLTPIPGSNSVVGSTEGAALSRETQRIKMSLGVVFGYKCIIRGYIPREPMKITYRIQHPPMRQKNGEISTGSDDIFTVVPEKLSYEYGAAYQLSEPNEMVAGRWVLTVLVNDQPVAVRSYILE